SEPVGEDAAARDASPGEEQDAGREAGRPDGAAGEGGFPAPRDAGSDGAGDAGVPCAVGSCPPLAPVALLAAGTDHTCAVANSDGVLRCWGRNFWGMLGT